MTDRMKILGSRSYAWLVYAILWGMAWGYPVLTALIVAVRTGALFPSDSVLHAWAGILPFFLLFLLHRLPVHYLFMRHRIGVYVLSVIGLLCLFGLCRYHSGTEKFRAPAVQEQRPLPHVRQPGRDSVLDGGDAGHGADTAGRGIRPAGPPPFRPAGPHSFQPAGPRSFQPAGHRPVPEGLPKPLLLDLVIAVLMLGFDLAIVLLSRYQEEKEKARRLETERLRYELEHLKAQVNPHFFMNMLNNIHGMVEMDSAKAQEMIMELSKLMRYVLYEGAKSYTPLYKETEFITNYVELMRKRYSSRKVHISLELPERNRRRVLLPPLLFISIIENAFKHGISYQSPSFVKIRLYMENDRLRLDCMNSIHRRPPKGGRAGGVGLANLRQRLQLLYGDGFTLDITEKDGKTYQVKLIIPCEYDADTMHGRR